MARDDDGASSERSGASGGADTSSQGSSHKSDLKALRREKHGNEEEQDLLEQKKSVIEGVYSCMYTLVRQSALSSWKFAVLKIFLEGLMAFIVVFNPSMAAWVIDTNNSVWQFVRWAVWRSPIMRLYGYDTYILVLYVMVAVVYLAVLGLVWLTLAMRRQEQSKWLKHAAVFLHVLFDLVFIMLYVSFFDYFVFTANCNFTAPVKDHVYFTGVECLKMPHILHMAVAVVTAVVFFCVTALMVIASSDLNPVSRGYLASPAAITRLRILCAKAFYVIVADDMQSWPKPQAFCVVVAVFLIVFWNLRRVPFYRTYVNGVWMGMWFGTLYTALLLVYITFGHDQSVPHRREVTLWVLYGIFPVVVGTSVLSYWRARLALRPAAKFEAMEPGVKVSKIHKFEGPMEVEVLARVVRQFNNDGDVVEEAAALGEKVIRAGMTVFPNNPTLLILYANFLLEVRKDGPAARTQLQLASKHSPTLLERYQIFCTGEASKKLKDSQDGGMDLQAYIEFRRNFRAVLRVHKEVLLLQAELWQLMLRSVLRVSDVDKALEELEAGSLRAHQVYKRVLERYPNNGKLLRCYGKFLEDVKHDPPAATRVYGEASRNGGGDAILNLDLSAIQSAADKPDFLTSMSMEDDAVIVINAEGTIMMCSQAVNGVFGYAKNELEGMNVSLLMPQPFSQRHPSYLSRYVNGGEPHILDSVREVVGLHKDRFVFPMSLCVTKMSGTGTDSVFLGVARPMAASCLNVRAWIAPNGVFLCGDTQFASMCGIAESELVGCTLEGISMTAAVEVQQLLEQCRAASEIELASGAIRATLMLRHRYMDAAPVNVIVGMAGTDSQRIYVLNCTRVDEAAGNVLVVDHHMRLRFASTGVGALLGYPARKLAGMRLDQLLPPPYSTLHAKWMQNPPPNIPPTSCRAGKVVYLQNEAGSAVPVRIKISAATGSAGFDANIAALNVVQVEKVSMEEQLEEKRWVLTADIRGRIRSVSRPASELFDFAGADLVGCSLCDTIDIFAEWRERNGESQLQLLMLALLDKEQEMPGTSWRVRVRAPPTAAAPRLPAVPGAAGGASKAVGGSKSACLQVELHEAAEGSSGEGGSEAGVSEGESATLVTVTLWRRDLLSGVVELDERLVVRRASPMAGLIVGLPAGAMLRKPVQKFLDMPTDVSWEDVVEQFGRKAHGAKQRSALKGAANSRGTVSPIMPFIGPHPDTGTVRILTQGVSVLGPGGRPKITLTLHPDTTFAGAHANLMRVLHLDGGSQSGAAAAGEQQTTGHGDNDTAAGAEAQRQKSMNKSKGKKAADRVEATAAAEVAPAAAAAHSGTPTRAPAATGLGADEEAEGLSTKEKEGVEGELKESSDEDRPHSEDGSGGVSEDSEGDGGDNGSCGSSGGGGGGGGRRGRRKKRGTNGGGGGRDLEAEDQAKLHGQAASKSDFVAQWVRTLTKNTSGVLDTSAPSRKPSLAPGASPGTPPAPAVAPGGGGLGMGLELALAHIPEDGVEGLTRAAVEAAGGQLGPGAGGGYMKPPPFGRIGSMLGNNAAVMMAGGRQVAASATQQLQAGGGRGGSDAGSGSEDGYGGNGGKKDKGGDKGEEWERGSEAESSASGSQAASGFTSVTDASGAGDLVIDSRRGRLLKALQKLVCGPALAEPMEKLRKHTYAIFALMLITHVITYVVISNEIKGEHHDVKLVHRQALAMDRSQLIAVRAMMGAFCERPNVTLKVSVCANSLNYTIGKLKENIALMEQHHQYVYMGDSAADTVMLMDDVYNVWTTKSTTKYNTFLDTSPPKILAAHAGVWVLGNRFIAAAREAVYWLPVIKEQYRLHRTFSFLVDNGIGPLFEVYAKSLDLLVNAAWQSVDRLRLTLIVLLVVEALVIQMSCLIYEWVLVQRLESSRLVALLAMLGLPGPILRQLATKEAKILEDDDDDESSDNDEEDHRAAAEPATTTRSEAGEPAGAAVAQQHQQEHQPGAAAGGVATARDLLLAAGGRSRKQQQQQPPQVVPPVAAEAGGVAAAAPYGSLPPAAMMKSVRHADSGDAANGNGNANGSDGGAARQSRLQPESGPELLKASTQAGAGAAGAAGPHRAGDGSDDSDSDDDGKPAARGAKISTSGGMLDDAGGSRRRSAVGGGRVSNGRGAAGRTARGLRINGKTLQPSFATVTTFMAPFVAWNIALVVVYAISLLQLEGMQGPLASLNMASHIIYRYTRVRAIAFGFVSQDDDTSRDIWRDMLATELRYFESEYNALMYGGTPITQTSAVFNHPVPPSTFFSSAFATEFFRSKKCFRYEPETCLQPGDPYYEVTHNGLDVMVRRMLAEMRLLSEDDDADVGYNSTRYMYMFAVGGRDLYEGLQQAAQLFVDYSISRYNQVVDIHTILLICTILGICAYLVLILWPHLARLKADAMRQSALLSHVPPELDVRAHVKAVFKRAQTGRGGKRGGGGGFQLLGGGGGGGGGGRNGGVGGEVVVAGGAGAAGTVGA